MIACASPTDIAPGLTDRVTERYPVLWSLLSAEAPCAVSGLTTEATSGALATSAAAWLTACEYLESVSFPLLTCSTIGLDPLAWSGNDLPSASAACWLLVPGKLTLSLVLSPRRCETATSATAMRIQRLRTTKRCRTQNRASR